MAVVKSQTYKKWIKQNISTAFYLIFHSASTPTTGCEPKFQATWRTVNMQKCILLEKNPHSSSDSPRRLRTRLSQMFLLLWLQLSPLWGWPPDKLSPANLCTPLYLGEQPLHWLLSMSTVNAMASVQTFHLSFAAASLACFSLTLLPSTLYNSDPLKHK